MRFREAAGRQVVSTSTAATLGSLDELVIDPRARAVVAVTLKKTHDGNTLRWADITAFGTDAVTVSRAERLADMPPELTDLSSKTHRVLGKRVLATTGDELGAVEDVEFDPGTISAIFLTRGEVAGIRLVGVGSHAVVVRAE